MPDFAQVLGDVIRNARLKLGLTQNELAERANIDVRTVLNIENHKGNPKLEVLFPLIRVLKVDPTSVFYPELDQNRLNISQFQSILSQCSESEIKALIQICESVLSVIKTHNGIHIPDEQ